MGRRRGFFAELQHQAAVAERERQRQAVADGREYRRQVREAERAAAAAERARGAAMRADARSRAAAEKEASRLHVQAQEQKVEVLNAQLASLLTDIDNVLMWTLSIDDHVDLAELHQAVEHPRFTSTYEKPLEAPSPIAAPIEPRFVEPDAPTGFSGLFGKKKHAAAVEDARARFAASHAHWQAKAAEVPMLQLAAMQKHQAAESDRLAKLSTARAAYDAECQARQAQVDAQNAQLDQLIAGHAAGDSAAVEEYFSIVFSNSVYPDGIHVDIEHVYHRQDKELQVAMTLPEPTAIPATRAFKYTKAKDEITETTQTAKEQRERYNAFVDNLVLRTLHEVWESDRARHVDTIALTAGVSHLDPATGQPTTTPLVAVAARRDAFEGIDLAHVTPTETLKHLKAVVSKNAHALTPIQQAHGVRG